MKILILALFVMTSFSAKAQMPEKSNEVGVFNEGRTFANIPDLLFSYDNHGHFAIYNPRTKEYLLFDLKYLNHIAAIESQRAKEDTSNATDYFYYLAKSLGGGVLALGQESLERLTNPTLPVGIIFSNPNTFSTKIFYDNAHMLEKVTAEKTRLQNRPPAVEILRIPEEYREAISELSNYAFLYNIVPSEKPVDAR